MSMTTAKWLLLLTTFMAQNRFSNKCSIWLDSEDIGKTRDSGSSFQINEINENNRNYIHLYSSDRCKQNVCEYVFLFVYCVLSVHGFLTGEHNSLDNGTLQGQGHTFHWTHRNRKLCHSHQLHQKFHTVVLWTCALGHIKTSIESFSNFHHTIKKNRHTTLSIGATHYRAMISTLIEHGYKYTETHKCTNWTAPEKKPT